MEELLEYDLAPIVGATIAQRQALASDIWCEFQSDDSATNQALQDAGIDMSRPPARFGDHALRNRRPKTLGRSRPKAQK
jgi:hypothetical protein